MSDLPPTTACSRQFDLRGDTEQHRVTAIFHAPAQSGDEWICGYRFEGLADELVRQARGKDGLESLLHAMQNAATHLYSSHAWKEGRLTFRGHEDLEMPLTGDLTVEDFKTFR